MSIIEILFSHYFVLLLRIRCFSHFLVCFMGEGGMIFPRTVVQGESFRVNCLGSKVRVVIVLGVISQGGELSGGSCPEGNYSGAIVLEAKVQGAIVLGRISWGEIIQVAVVQGENYSRVIVLEGSCLGGIVIEPSFLFENFLQHKELHPN